MAASRPLTNQSASIAPSFLLSGSIYSSANILAIINKKVNKNPPRLPSGGNHKYYFVFFKIIFYCQQLFLVF